MRKALQRRTSAAPWLCMNLAFVVLGVSVPVNVGAQEGRADPKARVEAEAIEVTLALSRAETVSAMTENDKRDLAVFASGTDKLGELPMGTGRTDPPFENNCYIRNTEMIGTVVKPDDLTGLSFRFKRFLSKRSWDIKKNGENWHVTKCFGRGTSDAGPYEDTTPDFDDNTPSATRKIYSHDSAGTKLNASTCAVGDFEYSETRWIYIVEARQGGAEWAECARQLVYQKILAKRVKNTGLSKMIGKGWATPIQPPHLTC